MVGWITGGIIYFVLLVTLGVIAIRKGHWIMFLVGLFIPTSGSSGGDAPAAALTAAPSSLITPPARALA